MIILLTVISSGFCGDNCAVITLNNEQLFVKKNINDHYRGLHIAVINSINGIVETAQVFDTYKSSTEFE